MLGKLARITGAIMPNMNHEGKPAFCSNRPSLRKLHSFLKSKRLAFARGACDKNTFNTIFQKMLCLKRNHIQIEITLFIQGGEGRSHQTNKRDVSHDYFIPKDFE